MIMLCFFFLTMDMLQGRKGREQKDLAAAVRASHLPTIQGQRHNHVCV